MRLIDRLRPALLRWDTVLTVSVVGLPFLAAMIAGFAWMLEHGWIVTFIVASISFYGVVSLTRLAARWWRGRSGAAEQPSGAKFHARIDPEWSASETRAFQEARDYISTKTSAPLPWDELYPVAEEVVRLVASGSGEKGKGVLDFTVPEALMLVDRVVVRLRRDMRDNVPFVDSVSVGTLYWLWTHREALRQARTHGMTAWRVFRAIKSLPVAILREIEGAIAEGHTSFITGEGTAILQALLLEEVAASAVDLYSGKLRFSVNEMLELRLAEGEEDSARLAAPDTPLRVAMAGQISAGKSSLVNALVGSNVAETDVIPTTDRPQTYPADFDGIAAVLLDMPGLDGSKALARTVLEELEDCDLILWTIRANRPAREIDRTVLAQLQQAFRETPERRMPPVIVVISCVDEILPDWPYPENLLSEPAMDLTRDIVAAVIADIGDLRIHPVPVVLTEPDWNIATLRARIDANVGEALMTQRNRLRIENRRSGLMKEATRAGRGLGQAFSIFGLNKKRPEDT